MFHPRFANDRAFIEETANRFGIPPETIMSAIFVEDVRFQFFSYQNALRDKQSIKTAIKKFLGQYSAGEDILKRMGHQTTLGNAHVNTYLDACDVLGMSPNPDVVDEVPSDPARRNEFQIERVGTVLAAFTQQWKDAGYDIFSYPFTTNAATGETATSQAQRIGILVTVYSQHSLMPAPRQKPSVPKPNPGLGGTYVEDLNMDYGHLAEGYARDHASQFFQPNAVQTADAKQE
jgi:hypothetical protein